DIPITICIPTTDADGDNLDVTTSFNGPSDGAISSLNDGDTCFVYTPDHGYNGGDTVSVVVCDGNGGCDTVVVVIDVTPVNDAPDANTDYISVTEDTANVYVDVQSNDSDPDGDGLTTSVITIPTNGTVTIENGDSLSYTPDLGFNGIDTVIYQICDDGVPILCDIDTVFITVNPVNDPPVALDDYSTTDPTVEDTIAVLTNDIDPEGGPLTVTVITQPPNGTATVLVDGTIEYVTDGVFVNGVDSFTYVICDNGIPSLCDTAQVYIVVPLSSLPPVAVDDYTIVDEDDSVSIDVTFNDIDPNIPGDTLTVTVFSGPDNGTVTITGDTIAYTPDPNFTGVDSLVYVICDTANFCDSATVYITVLPENDAPDAVTDNVSTNEDTPVVVDVQDNDTDPDGDGLITSVVVASSNGTVSILNNDSITYSPNPGFNGLDTVIYQICDNGVPAMCDIDTVFITVISINDIPIITDGDTISTTTPEDTPITICINVTDGDNDSLEVTSSFSGPTDGAISGLNDGDTCFVYTPDPVYNGGDTVTVEVCDGNGGCDTVVVVINVTPVNDPPEITDLGGTPIDTTSLVTPVDVPITICLYVVDVDSDSLEVTSTFNGPSSGSISGTGDGDTCLVYTPDLGYVGGDTVSVVICDNNGGCDTVVVVISVTPAANNPPVIVDAGGNPTDTILESTPVNVPITICLEAID
ncbi:Ig-like domain-containing protein, partial [bacterium]|nr:Ig-like domain-containing protein [bacterium]